MKLTDFYWTVIYYKNWFLLIKTEFYKLKLIFTEYTGPKENYETKLDSHWCYKNELSYIGGGASGTKV